MNFDFRERLAEAERLGRFRTLRTVSGAQRPMVSVDGKEMLLFSSNNYLSLAEDPRLAEAAVAAIRDYGSGGGASRLLSGNTPLHNELETALAKAAGTESALVFASGYQANIGLLPALVGDGDLVLSDALNHASLIDGCRLSGALIRIIPHGEVAAVRKILERERTSFRRALVVTEGIFSMDGDRAQLPELWEACERHEAALLVDDAHGFGIAANGRGSAEAAGLPTHHPLLIQLVTLGKALGSQGAAVCGANDLRAYLINSARSFIFATALAPALCAAARSALAILEKEPERPARLLRNIRHFSRGLLAQGVSSRETPIQPVLAGSDRRALRLAKHLEDAGIFARAIRPPTVPEGSCRIRFSLMADHTPEQLDRALAALATFRDENR